MNLPSDTPKMPKWAFWLGDLILVAAAWFVHDGAEHPNSGVALVATVACVVAAVFVFVTPFIVEYARRQDEALDNRQRALQALSVTVAAAAEQVSIAATGLQGIAEAAQDNFSRTERLSQQISEKIAALDARLAAAKRDDGDSAAKLESVAKKIAKSAAEFDAAVSRAAEAARAAVSLPVNIPEVAPVIASRIAEIRAAVPVEAPAPPAPAPEPAPLSAAAPAEPPSPETPAPVPETAPSPLEAAPAPAPAPVPRKRAPRKVAAPVEAPPAAQESAAPEPATPLPAPETETPAPSAASPEPVAPAPEPEAPAATPALILESSAPDEAPQAAPQETPEPAVSADGATRLIVTAYIGIGNRLFIRGEGPGLSWEKGIPLSFISIGKWRWETNDATSTVRFRIYKNDQIECTGLGEASVEPGAQQELSAVF